jgi:hypothetical protein
MNDRSDISYPDNGNPLEDAAVLRNAVYFSTAQRAFTTESLLRQPMGANQEILNYVTLNAFESFMTSTEDLLGWLFALKEWQPGTAEKSLFILIDKIQIGRGRHTEEYAIALLTELDGEGFRTLLHIPDDGELISSGISKEFVDNLKRSLPFKLSGWLKLAQMRQEQNRGRVGMFNKVKHHILVFPSKQRNKSELFVPFNVRIEGTPPSILIGKGQITADVNTIRKLSGDALAAQAVLHDTLAIILITRFAERNYQAPTWVVRVFRQWAYSD